MFFSNEQTNRIMRSLLAPNGKRVDIVRDETYQTALEAAKKVIRDDRKEGTETARGRTKQAA